MLVDIVNELRERTRELSDSVNDNKIFYDLKGEIRIENGNGKKVFYKGRLIYETPKRGREARSAGKMIYSPSKNGEDRVNIILGIIKEIIAEDYQFSYNSKESTIRINVIKNLEEELQRAEEVLEELTRQEFKI